MKSTKILEFYGEVNVSCRCGNTFTTRSVLRKPLTLDVCSHCHPYYKGTQQTVESGNRVQQFQRKYARSPLALN